MERRGLLENSFQFFTQRVVGQDSPAVVRINVGFEKIPFMFDDKMSRKPTPAIGSPIRLPISMYTIESVMGMPSLRSSTSLR